MKTDISRSSTWQSGRKQICSSPSSTGTAWSTEEAEKMTFPWEIIAPLGSPVVPEV